MYASPSAQKAKRQSQLPELSDAHRAEIREVFELSDMDKDGALGYHDLRAAIGALGFDMNKADVLKILKDHTHDPTGRGLLSSADFMKIMSSRILARDPDSEIRRTFQLMADEKTGKISLQNLRCVANKIGDPGKDEELRAMIDNFDLDQDGEINEREFFAVMTDNARIC
ncbi:Ca2+-binding EF-hand superfamily protein [Mycena galericulata]|nr:Ca2+-binding EF-hand superfamily protein [Mycena galericulata]KAJ7504600.1 Ca2+-binding EF-hand superfamily protein [Mycena galericulata]